MSSYFHGVLKRLVLPKFTNLAFGLLGFAVAYAPWGLLSVILFFEQRISPNCGGDCFSTGFGWVLLFALVVSFPAGICIVLAGLIGFLKACAALLRKQFK